MQERADLGTYLQPSTYVLVNDEIKALANQIVGGEQNPVLAARKIYDWTLHNIDYWVRTRASQSVARGQRGILFADENGQLHGFSFAVLVPDAGRGDSHPHGVWVTPQTDAQWSRR